MEGRCERRDDGWWLLVPAQGSLGPQEVAFPSLAVAEQAARLLALHTALHASGQPPEEVTRIRAELEAHDPGCCDDEALEDLRQYTREQLLDMLRAAAAGEDQDSEEAPTVSTAAAPPQPCAAEGDAPGATAVAAGETTGAGQPASGEEQQERPQQHELLQEPAAQPQLELAAAAPQQQPVPQQPGLGQPASQQQAVPQQAAPQQQQQQLYQHYFGVSPQVPHPSVNSYKAQLSVLLSSAGHPQRPSRKAGGKMAQTVCLLACPTQAEAAAARDLGALWREHRLWGGSRGGAGGKPHPFHRTLLNFDKARWEQDQPELLAAVQQCATFQQLQRLLAIKMADGTLRALGASMPRDAASWQVATQRAAGPGKRWQRSLKRALYQLAPGRGSSWDGVQLGSEGGAASAEDGGGRRRRHTRLVRSASLSDSYDYGYGSDPGTAGEPAAAAAAAAAHLHRSRSAGAAQAALLTLNAAPAAVGAAQQGQPEAFGSSMATEGTAPDEWESDYLGVRLCPGGTWRAEVALRLDALGAPALDGFKCRQPVELGTELEAALVRDLGLLWYEQHCGPAAFREERLWNFALRRYLLDAPLWSVLAQLPHWPAFASYLAQLQASGQLLAAAKSYDEGELPAEWPDPYPSRPLEQQPHQQQPQQQQQQPVRKQQRQGRRPPQPQQPDAGAAVAQRGRRARQQGRRGGRERSPGLTTAEAAAAARACKATADAAAAKAPPEPWEQLAATWRQQSQRRAEGWEAAVQPYDTSWLLQASHLQHMLCPAPAEGQQRPQPAGTAGGLAAKGKGARGAAGAAPAAAGVQAPGAGRGHKRRQQQQPQQQQQQPKVQQPQQQHAKRPQPGHPGQPQPLQHDQHAQHAQQAHQAQQAQQHQHSSDEAATALPAAAQLAPSHVQQQERTPLPAGASPPLPAQQVLPAAAPAVHASPATPAIQLAGPAAAELRALLDALPVSPHLPDSESIAQRQPPPVPAPGDVLLYCRRTSGMAGLPLLERLLVLSADALDPPSPRFSHRCTCLLVAQGANPLQLEPPPGGPALKAVEVGPSGFKAKLLAVRATAQWSVVGHVGPEPMNAVHNALAALDLR